MPSPKIKFLVIFNNNSMAVHSKSELAGLEDVSAIFRVRVTDGQIQINTEKFTGNKQLIVNRNSNLRFLAQELYGNNQNVTRPSKRY